MANGRISKIKINIQTICEKTLFKNREITWVRIFFIILKNIFLRTIFSTLRNITAFYAQDNDVSIFTDEQKIFNLNNLGDRLKNIPNPISGINTPNGYLAGPGSSSSFHCEDQDLYSVSNNIYGGVRKTWELF